MTPETPLNQDPIRCAACDQVVKDLEDWWSGDCPASPKGVKGHDLTRPQWMLLEFSTEEDVVKGG